MNAILKINGEGYAGWKRVSISSGLDRLCRSFDLTITWKFPGNVATFNRIKPFDKCELWIEKEKVLTGYVYAAPVSYDANSVSTTISGRSLTSLLVDCSTIGKSQYRGQKVIEIIKAMALEYGINVVDESGVGGEIKSFVPEKGEKVQESLQKLMSQHRLVFTDNGNGDLVIAKVGGLRANDNLEVGKNIKSCSAHNDWANVYSRYVINGQSASGEPTDLDDEEDSVEGGFTFEREIKSNIAIKRVLVIKQTGKGTSNDAEKRLKFEQDSRIGKAKEREYVVQGWQQSNGELWKPNMLVSVIDSVSGINEEMLIIEVTYKIENGATTIIKVSPPDGYGEYNKQYKTTETKKSGGKSSDSLGFIPSGL